ncbi:MAG TPA: ABC transporter permease [Methylomirabilota bacterium]|nr:ABC transporter permease [Methylomirabilota bacterium]
MANHTATRELAPVLPVAWRRPAWWRGLVRFCRRKPLGAAGAFIMAAIVVTALFADVLATSDPIATEAARTLAPPDAAHWLGSDHLGRDIYSRIVHGARVSLMVGIGSTLLGSVLGGIIGLLSGYAGGKTDLVAQRLLDILQGLPLLVLALVMAASLGPSIPNVIVAISIPIVPRAARVIRASVLSIREMQYIEAARALGAGHRRIMLRHILPNVMATIVVISSIGLGGIILAESALSFLGYGVPPPHPSWGSMLSGSGRTYMYLAPWMAIWPGVAISLVVFAFNMLGDALRDVFDPRLRGSRGGSVQ